MGTDAIGFTLSILTAVTTMVAVKFRNMLITLGAAIMWAVMLAFFLGNTTAGTNWLTMFILCSVAFMSAFALIGFFSRRGASAGETLTGGLEYRETGQVSERPERKAPKSLLDLEPNMEYKAYLRSRMNRRRRR